MELNPFVSVIIPVYNAENYIAETLSSVLKQSYPHFEVLVVDNGSTDGSGVAIEESIGEDSRVRVVSLDTNSGGPAKPRNVGITELKGEYVCFLDADDVWHRDKLKKQIELVHAGFNFLCSKADYIDKDSQPLKSPGWFQKFFSSKELTVEALCWQNPVITSSVMVEKKLLDKHCFDEDPLLAGAEDCLLWMTLLAKPECKSFLSLESLLSYRILGNSTSRQGGRQKAHVLKEYAMCKFALSQQHYSVQSEHVFKKAVRSLLRRFR